jgi:hypothetical protein
MYVIILLVLWLVGENAYCDLVAISFMEVSSDSYKIDV